MSRERQAKPVPSVWPKNGPLGTLFLTHGLAWVIHGFWYHVRHALTDFRTFLDTGRNGDGAPTPTLLLHDMTPFWRPDSHKNNPARGYSEGLRRVVGSLPIPPRPRKKGAAFPLISLFVSPAHLRLATVATLRCRSWPYVTVRRHGREKFPFAIAHPLMVGEGAG